MRTRPLSKGYGLLAALALLGAGARAQFQDYTRRVPVTITNNSASPTPAPTSAEVTIPFNAATMRADRADVRVGYDDGNGIQEIDSRLFRETVNSTDSVRVVFRLQQPIAANGSSTGQYFVYYGNPSPSQNPKRVLGNIFDHIVDFQAASNVVGQPAPDWDVQMGNTVTVENYKGGKVGVLRQGLQYHPRATVKQSAMPSFVNSEMLAHIAPKDKSGEMAAMTRVVSNPSDPYFQGGYGYGVNAWGGANAGLYSYVNPAPGNIPGAGYTADPSYIVMTPATDQADQYQNILFRIDGNPGILEGKNWADNGQEPANWMLTANRQTQTPWPLRGNPPILDPAYDQPGTTGVTGYSQAIAIDFIALRELRDLSNSTGAEEILTPAGPFLQGTVSSNVPALNPLQGVTVHITGPGVDDTFSADANGFFKLTVPAGSYTVEASAPYHATASVNASASPSDLTNITLTKNQAAVRTQIARVPSIPNSAQTARIWIYSDTVPGETACVNYKAGNGAPVIVEGTEDSSYPGANWYADIPSQRDGTSVSYELVTKAADSSYYGNTGIGANGMQYTATDPSLPTGGAVNSSPVAFNGKTYFGSDDGKLYGYDLTTLAALADFPFNTRDVAGAGAKILGRPALRAMAGSFYLFFSTDNGYLFRLHLNADGSLDTVTDPPASYRPDSTAADVTTTPAVFAIGGTDYIFAAMTTSTGARLFKVPAASMVSNTSLDFSAGSTTGSSPAGGGGVDVYLGIGGTASQGVYRVQASDLTVTNSFALGEAVSSSPFISGTGAFGLPYPTMYVGTESGKVYAVNATNGSPVATFGNAGVSVAWNGQKITSTFLWDKKFYIVIAGTTWLLTMDAETGFKTDWFNIGYDNGGWPVRALAVDPGVNGNDYLFLTNLNSTVWRLNVSDTNDRTIYRLPDGHLPLTTPAVDVTTGKVVIGATNNRAYVYPR